MARRGPLAFPRQTVRGKWSSSAKLAIMNFDRDVKEKVLRSAAYGGAVIFYEYMRLHVPGDTSKWQPKTGNLRRSIYHWYDTRRSNSNRKIYVIGPNKTKAPHWHLVEFGHWRVNKWIWVRGAPNGGRWTRDRLPAPKWVVPYPYIRPTFDRVGTAAENAKLHAMKRLKELGKA